MFFTLPDLTSAIIRNPPAVDSTASVAEAIAQLSRGCSCCSVVESSYGQSPKARHQEVDCVLILDENRVRGLLTEKDLARFSGLHNISIGLAIPEAKRPPAVMLRESALTDVASIFHLLQQPSVRYLPVVDEGDRLVGLMTQSSLLQALKVVEPVYLSEEPAVLLREPVEVNARYSDWRSPRAENIERHISKKVSERIATLQESEERWALAIEGTHDGIWDQNLITGDHFLSPRCMEIVGYDYTEIDSFEKWLALVHPDDQVHLQATFQAYLNREVSSYVCEYRVKCREGQYKWLLARGKALWDEAGTPVRAVGSITDISDRKQAEELLRQSEARYRAIVEDQTELITRFRPDGTLLFVNDAFCRYFGISKTEVIGRSYKPRVYPDDQAAIDRCLAALSPETPVSTTENRVIVNGEVRWMQWINRAFYDTQGTLVELQSVGCDIHERKQAELALAQTTQQLQAFLDNAPAVIGLFDAEGRYLRVNPALAQLLDRPAEEIVGKTFAELFPNSLVRLLHTRMKRLAETQYPLEVEDEVQINGSEITLRSLLFPVKPDAEHDSQSQNQGESQSQNQGENQRDISPTTFWAIATDITERKRIENALKKKTEELDQFFSVALDLLCIANTDGYFLRLNSQWEKTLGYSLQELEGSRFLDYVHPDDIKSTLDTLMALSQQREVHNFVNRYRCREGSYRWIEWRATPVGRFIYAAARDITDRKEAEEFLRKSEERFATVFHSNPSPGWITNLEGRFLEINESFSQFYGASPETLVGRTCTDLHLWDRPEDKQAFQHILQTTQRLPTFEVVWRTQSGEPRTVLLSANVSWINDEECIIGVLKDITDRKQTELEIQQAQQAAESANQAKSAFISCMKHELRSPLNSILGFAHQLKQDSSLQPDQQDRAGTIERSAKNLLSSINQVLDVAEFDYPQCYLNLRHRYVNGDGSHALDKLALQELDQALAHLPEDLLTQLEQNLYLGEPRAIAQMIATITAYDAAIGSLLAEKANSFQYVILLDSIKRIIEPS